DPGCRAPRGDDERVQGIAHVLVVRQLARHRRDRRHDHHQGVQLQLLHPEREVLSHGGRALLRPRRLGDLPARPDQLGRRGVREAHGADRQQDACVSMNFPALFDAADTIAAESQRKFLRALRAEVLALSAAALVAQFPARQLSGAGPIASLALFAVAGEAYRVEDPAAEARFQDDLRRYLGQLPHLDVPTGSPAQCGATSDMQALRRMPVPDRAETYLRDRVEDQLDWYSTNARRNKQRARRWWAATVAIEAAAIAVGLARVIAKFDIDWLGVLAAIAASL